MKNSILEFRVKNARGTEVPMSDYAGKVMLIVNTASKCGLTPQLEKLEALHQEFKDRGFTVIGFPSNDFGEQEPLSADKAEEFCQVNYGVTFPIMEKIHVKGDGQHELYKYMSEKAPGPKLVTEPKWNFHKFLVDKTGKVVDFFIPTTAPDDEKIKKQIRKHLEK